MIQKRVRFTLVLTTRSCEWNKWDVIASYFDVTNLSFSKVMGLHHVLS